MNAIMRERARYLKKNMTDAERSLWSDIRRRQISNCQFRRQYPMGKFIVDFICLEKMLIIEVDGGQHTEEQEYDEARTKWLESQGYKVLRFWNFEVMKYKEAVLQTIEDALC